MATTGGKAVAVESIIPSAAIAFALVFFASTRSLPEEAQRFPNIAVGVILVFGVWCLVELLVRHRRELRGEVAATDDEDADDVSEDPARRRLPFWSYWFALAVWPVATGFLGFYTSSFLLVVFLAMTGRDGSPEELWSRQGIFHGLARAGLMAAIVTVVFFFLALSLNINLPRGILL